MKKHLILVRLQLVLAMVCTLVAIDAAPVNANVTAVTVIPALSSPGDLPPWGKAVEITGRLYSTKWGSMNSRYSR